MLSKVQLMMLLGVLNGVNAGDGTNVYSRNAIFAVKCNSSRGKKKKKNVTQLTGQRVHARSMTCWGVADGSRHNPRFRSMLAAHAATATSALLPTPLS